MKLMKLPFVGSLAIFALAASQSVRAEVPLAPTLPGTTQTQAPMAVTTESMLLPGVAQSPADHTPAVSNNTTTMLPGTAATLGGAPEIHQGVRLPGTMQACDSS
jgi:hypothetical protein